MQVIYALIKLLLCLVQGCDLQALLNNINYVCAVFELKYLIIYHCVI